MAKSSAEKSAAYRAKDVEAYRAKKREYARTPEQRAKRTAYMAGYREANRESTNESARISHAKVRAGRSSEERHDQHLRATYKIGRKTYLAMLERQGGKCAICGSDTSRWKHRFHVDHCHLSGLVRGLLCNRCNPMLGWVEPRMKEILNYLKQGSK